MFGSPGKVFDPNAKTTSLDRLSFELDRTVGHRRVSLAGLIDIMRTLTHQGQWRIHDVAQLALTPSDIEGASTTDKLGDIEGASATDKGASATDKGASDAAANKVEPHYVKFHHRGVLVTE